MAVSSAVLGPKLFRLGVLGFVYPRMGPDVATRASAKYASGGKSSGRAVDQVGGQRAPLAHRSAAGW
ncbi:MAG: hypothetical protein M1126_00005, partial [Candidatus Thermoplasmatota archaeon]|nr:hypothetical protein [Candidatus Thermoplasmatota archaeon]